MCKIFSCFIFSAILCLFIAGCENDLRLENQIKNEMKYSKVFLNSANSITAIGVPDENGERKIVNFKSYGDMLRIINGKENKVVWHTYSDAGPKGKRTWDVIVYTVDGEISGGEHNKGKFGKDKLHEL